jgi:hypothetical protein
MSLYGRTDSNTNKSKAGIGLDNSSQAKTVVFVDNTEAALEQNKARGINAPGWWSYYTFTDSGGNTRHKAELLVTIADPDTTETQADDTIAGDAASSVAIDTQPQNASVEANESNTATFTVATTVTGAGSATYQWQVNNVDISGATSASYETAAVVAGDNGNAYRCRVGTSQGATEVISDAATLTVT